jgi:hypothetical protein
MALFVCIAGCNKVREDSDDESISDISELSYPTKTRSPVVHVPPKPAIIGTGAPTDKAIAKDQGVGGKENAAGRGSGAVSDAHAAAGEDGGKTEDANPTSSQVQGMPKSSSSITGTEINRRLY